ncbi:MAG: EAL domain-containing protein [Gammaproteobacteria bacterium]|nr:EAL domain-containing protein [Gammaproteobacteria bacterium]
MAFKHKFFLSDELISIVLFIISSTLLIYFDTFERIHIITRKHEEYELDELFFLSVPLSIIFAWYSYRRNKEIKLTLKKVILADKTDTITNLPNHVCFREDYLLHKDDTNQQLIIINIVNFKHINYSLGIEIGDLTMKYVAKRLQSSINKYAHEKVYRLYGDEYAFFYKGNTLDTFTVTNKIKNEFEKHSFSLNGIDIYINLNISFSNREPKFSTALFAIQEAKTTLSAAIVSYNENINYIESSKQNLLMLETLKIAKEKDQFIPFFQPIIDNNNGKIVKYETLIRIKNEETIISPFYFLELSKKFKTYPHITKTVIEKSIKIFSCRDEEFSINLSYIDINSEDIMSFLFKKIEENKETASRMIIELVENEEIKYSNKIASFRNKLYEYGIKLAIDDFGSGYSNWVNVLKLKPSYIKIDGSLIKDLLTNQENYNLVESIVTFAQKNNIMTIAEFVINEDLHS